MTRFLVLIALFIGCSAQAETNSLVIAISRGQVPVSVALEVPADYVAIPISISSAEKDPLRNFENVQTFLQRLSDTLKKSPTIRLHQGAISLSVAQGEDNGFSSFKSATVPTSSTSLFLAAPFSNDRDIFQVARDITTVVKSVPKTEQIRVTYGPTSLGVEAPEHLRSRLLSLIRKDIEQTKAELGNPKSFEVSGLESPVAVMQRDDRNVVVYLPYRLKVSQ